MSRIAARNAKIYFGGRDFTGRLNNCSLSMSAEVPEITCFGEDNRTRLHNGIKDSEFSVNGFYDTAASQIGEELASLFAGSALYGFYYNSAVAGCPGREFRGVLSEYSLDDSVDGAAALTATVSGSDVVFFTNSLGSYSVSNSGTSGSIAGSSVDFSASSASAIGVFRVFSTNVSLSASLQDSTNGSTWTTRHVFTATSVGNTAERSSTLALLRYRRIIYAFSGASPYTAVFMASSGSSPI